MDDRELFIRSLDFSREMHYELLKMSIGASDKEFIESALMFFRHNMADFFCENDCDIVDGLQDEIDSLETERYENVEEKDDEICLLNKTINDKRKIICLIDEVLNGNISLDVKFFVVFIGYGVDDVFMTISEAQRRKVDLESEEDNVDIHVYTLRLLCKHSKEGRISTGMAIGIYNKLKERLKDNEDDDQQIMEIRRKIYR